MDVFSKEKRSWVMQQVKDRNTKPERVVRSLLHRLGYRFRLCPKHLPGKPDIVLPRHHRIIFVHSCFWHQHQGCARSSRPSTNTEFWNAKLDGNVKRDRTKREALEKLGWRVLTLWECQVEKAEVLAEVLSGFLA